MNQTTSHRSSSCVVPSSLPINMHESTYALLVRSEEKERGAFEMLAYGMLVLCAIFSMWQFAQQSVNVPVRIGVGSGHVVSAAGSPATVSERI